MAFGGFFLRPESPGASSDKISPLRPLQRGERLLTATFGFISPTRPPFGRGESVAIAPARLRSLAGLTPKQNSSGGKAKLGAITKQGNPYIRRLLVVGSTSVLRHAGKRKGTSPSGSPLYGPESRSASSPWRSPTGENLLGDHDRRRMLPSQGLRQGIASPSEASFFPGVRQAQQDVMIDTVGTEAEDTPPRAASLHELAEMIRTEAVGPHQGQRRKRRAKRPDIGQNVFRRAKFGLTHF